MEIITEGNRQMKIIEGEFPFFKEWDHEIALAGAGGKTTLMYALAENYAGAGARVIVTTTTHIFRPDSDRWVKTPEEAERLWQQGKYAVVGLPAVEKKLKALPEKEMEIYRRMADIVLVEADGAKGKPCKVPAAHEPVIPDTCDIVIGVMGMDAWGKPLKEVCFRYQEAAKLLRISETGLLTEKEMTEILASEKGTRKNAGGRDYYIVLNKCDSKERLHAARQIKNLLGEQGGFYCVCTSFAEEGAR